METTGDLHALSRWITDQGVKSHRLTFVIDSDLTGDTTRIRMSGWYRHARIDMGADTGDHIRAAVAGAITRINGLYPPDKKE